LADDAQGSDHTKSVVLGGIDGILTGISVASAAFGANYSWQFVVIIGFSTIAAGAVAIGGGEFLSSKAHKEFVNAEKRRGQWEFKHDRAGQIKEMAKLFEFRGMKRQDAELVVGKMAQYESFFVNLIVTEELGLQPPEDDDITLVADAFVMFASYACFGSIPLIVYAVGPVLPDSFCSRDLYSTSAVVTSLALFTLGSAKSSFR